ncbi:MAG: UbiA family prenyltransferase [Thermoplasmatota archaeon]
MVNRPIEILRLFRIHTAAATASIATIAVLAAGSDLITALLIFAGCVLNHAWGFSLNEIGDLEVDRRSSDLSHKPIVSGAIGIRSAWIYSMSALVLSFILILGSAVYSGTPIIYPAVFLITAVVSGFIYDLRGKRFPSDIFVSAWIFFLVLACSTSTVRFEELPLAVWAVVFISPIQLLFNNSVEGGIKDLDHDREAGAKTMALSLGCRWEDGKRHLSGSFIIWGMALRVAFVISAVVFTYIISEQEGFGYWLVLTVGTIGAVIFAHSLTFLRSEMDESRRDLIKRFSIQEILSFAVSILIVIAAVGIIPGIAIFLLTMMWFVLFNRLLFRTGISPKV